MGEIIFLLILGLVWIVFASIQDLKSREVANWLSFSLIIFAMGFRYFYSLFSGQGFGLFYQGLIGLAIFFVLGNVFYYGRMFAGGDAKLMIALGAILPLSEKFLVNLKIFALFFILFLFSGMVYGLFFSGYLMTKNFKSVIKELGKKLKKSKKLIYLCGIIGWGIILIGLFFELIFVIFGVMFLILPYLYFLAKVIDDVCMVKKINANQLTEGDWLYKDVKVGRKVIQKNWEGLTMKEIGLIKKNKIKFVFVRQGIPFVPVFLISFVIFVLLWISQNTLFFWDLFL